MLPLQTSNTPTLSLKTNFPWATVAVFAIVVIAVTTLVISGYANNGTVTVLIGLIPGLLLGTGYAERTARDIRNGVVEAKAQSGAQAALDQTGVTAIAQQSPDTTRLAMQALERLLETNTAATNANTAMHNQQEGGA